jgi:transposase
VSVNEPNAQASDGDARIVALSAEIAALRNDNTSLRDDLARTQGVLANLRVRYHQLLEELHLLKRRLIVAKAERLDDVAEAQLAFDKLLAETQAIEKVLDATDGAADDNDEDDDAEDKPKDNRRPRTGPPPTGRRKLEESGLPEVRVELADPGLEGKAERIGVEESSRVAYERGGYRRLVLVRIVYKEGTSDEVANSNGGTAAAPKAPTFRIVTVPMPRRS